jgi:hypothetical protein
MVAFVFPPANNTGPIRNHVPPLSIGSVAYTVSRSEAEDVVAMGQWTQLAPSQNSNLLF